MIKRFRLTEATDWKNKFRVLGNVQSTTAVDRDRQSAAADEEAVWDEFYSETWPGNEEKVKKLGRAVKLECREKGFTAAENPFIQFINWIVSQSDLRVDAMHYGVVHNEYIDKRVTDEDLAKITPQLNNRPVIYCKDFYKKQTNECATYIDYQQQIIQAVDDKLIKSVNDAVQILYASEDKLNDLSVVEEKFKAAAGQTLNKNAIEAKKTPFNVSNLTVLNGKPDVVQTLVNAIITKYSVPSEQVQKVIDSSKYNIKNDFYDFNSTAGTEAYNTYLKDYNINNANAIKVIDSLMQAYYPKKS